MTKSKKERAIKWLRQIQREHFETHLQPTHSQTMQHLAGSAGYSQMLVDPFGYVDNHIHEYVVGPLVEYLPELVQSIAAETPVGTLLTSDPNACAIRSVEDDLGPVIIVDWTLWVFLGEVIKPILRILDRIPKEDKFVMARRILDAGEYFSTGGKKGNLTSHEYDDALVNMANVIEIGALTFIVCHEYAHVLLGHLDSRDVTVKQARFAKYNKSWEQEFDADMEGLRLARKCLQNTETELLGKSVSGLACGAPLMLMSIFDFLKRFSSGGGASSTHPPTLDRRHTLVKAMDGSLSEHANIVTDWFEWILAQPWEDVEEREDG